jgi:hypothetical protein
MILHAMYTLHKLTCVRPDLGTGGSRVASTRTPTAAVLAPQPATGDARRPATCCSRCLLQPLPAAAASCHCHCLLQPLTA